MLWRKIQKQFCPWRARNDRNALVVSGALQVGKTYAVEHFGREFYPEQVTVNFKKTSGTSAIFQGGLTI